MKVYNKIRREGIVMKIKWLGHSTFQIKSESTLVIDPHNPEAGGRLPDDLTADTVLVTHGHMDHNFTQAVSGNPQIFSQLGDFESGEYKIRGVASFHDNSEGTQRGSNIIYKISAEGLRLCHMGDLGHVLNAKEIQELGEVDILMIPVGGYYTIDANEAVQVVKQLSPKIVLPMHYKPKNSDIVYNITGVDPFCGLIGWEVISEVDGISINTVNLSSMSHKVVVFAPST